MRSTDLEVKRKGGEGGTREDLPGGIEHDKHRIVTRCLAVKVPIVELHDILGHHSSSGQAQQQEE